MNYSLNKLGQVADCDKMITLASDLKSDLQFEHTLLMRESAGREKTAIQVEADLASVLAQITAFEAAKNILPEGPEKQNFESRIRRLNDRRENLLERQAKSGNTALIGNELERARIEAQVAEVDAFLLALEQRKTEL